eukprot:PhF_6_TR32433/c0_g1_i1/m.48142/K04947/KCNT2; potassium channel subfamily T member 2
MHSLSQVFLILLILMELVSVSAYIWSNEADVSWNTTGKTELQDFTVSPPVLVLQGLLSIVFTIEYIIIIIVAKDPVKAILDFYSLVALCTTIPMNIVAIGASIDYDNWKGGFVPMFLRVWWAYRATEWLVSIPQLQLDAIKVDLFMQVFSLACIMTTSAGVFQICESFSETYLSFFDSSYFIVVTFATVGYGDIYSKSRIGRAALLIIIGVAVVSLPGVLTSVNEFIALRRRFTRYHHTKRIKHVVFLGKITKGVMKEVLNEFYCGTRSLTRPVNVVFMCPDGFDEDSLVLAKDPWWARKLALIQGDPRSREDLERACVDTADAIFVLLNRELTSSRGDMEVIQQMWTVSNFTSEVPVYSMTKRPNNINFLTGNNTTTLELEEIKFNLIGQSVLRPGIISMLINLVRTFEDNPNTVEGGEWLDQYLISRGNEIYAMKVPQDLQKLCFLTAAQILKQHHGATALGVARDNKVVLNPRHYELTTEDELLYIAPDPLEFDETPLQVSSEDRRRDETFRSIVVPPRLPAARRPRIEFDDHQVDNIVSVEVLENGHTVKKTIKVIDFEGIPERDTKDLTKRRTAPKDRIMVNDLNPPIASQFLKGLNLKDHIILLELSSTLEVPSLSPEEETDGVHSQCKDLWDVLNQIKQDDPTEMHEIVVLSRLKVDEDLLRQWNGHGENGYRPIIFVQGCGTNHQSLELLSVHTASTVIILSSSAGSFDLGDTVISVVHHNVRKILDKHNVTRPLPIIVELDTVESVHLFPPQYNDVHLRREALDDFTLVPKYVTGEAICSTMLDTALYQSYNNKYVIETVKRLVTGVDCGSVETQPEFPLYRDHPSRLRSQSFASLRGTCSHDLLTVQDVFTALLEHGHVLLGVYKRTTAGFGFMQTNPPPGDSIQNWTGEEQLHYLE